MGVKAEGTLRVGQGEYITSASLGYPPSVFNKKPILKMGREKYKRVSTGDRQCPGRVTQLYQGTDVRSRRERQLDRLKIEFKVAASPFLSFSFFCSPPPPNEHMSAHSSMILCVSYDSDGKESLHLRDNTIKITSEVDPTGPDYKGRHHRTDKRSPLNGRLSPTMTLRNTFCSTCVWNSFVFSYLASHTEWRCLRCLSKKNTTQTACAVSLMLLELWSAKIAIIVVARDNVSDRDLLSFDSVREKGKERKSV